MMRAHFVSLFVISFAVGCSSNEKGGGGSPIVDSGVTSDTAGGGDTSTPSDTAAPSDSTPPGDTSPSDTKTDTPAAACDKNQHPGDECDLMLQNCTDATKTCIYDNAKKHNTCAAVAFGTAGAGEACTMSADCDKGLQCRDKICSPTCCPGDDSACVGGGKCNLGLTVDGKVVYYGCSYAKKCNPFMFDCPTGQYCTFDGFPDEFACSTPAPGSTIGQAPGGSCESASNACGESQGCFSKGAGTAPKCELFCWITKPAGWTWPGAAKADGRFVADGTCTVGGVNYGTCQAVDKLGGGLGLCVK